jgi:hypothetical protein
MLRITELKLPLGHPPEALREALIALSSGIDPADCSISSLRGAPTMRAASRRS